MPDETILDAIAGNKSEIYGLKFGDETRFAVLDVDKNSRYRSDLELAKLQEKLAAVGLTAKPYRSSESGGWHLYIFFDEWAPSREVRESLSDWLRAHSYEIRDGVLEVNPSGRGLRLPLQPGFAWLDDKGEVTSKRKELSRDEALAAFLIDLENNQRNWSEAKSGIESELEAIDRAKNADALTHEKAIDIDGFEKLFNYRLIPERYEEGRRYWASGLTANGQRHDAILAVEHYLWHGDSAAGVPALPAEHYDEARYRLILAWLERKHNGFCNHINKGNWRKVEQQVRRACLWRASGAPKARTPYPMTERAIERLIALYKSTGRVWSIEDLKKGNDGREQLAREKIREAVQLLTDQGRRVTCRQLMRLTGCSYHTVKRHLDIWQILPVVALPRAAGDRNPFLDLLGGGGAAPVADGSGSEKSFLNPACSGDSGDLDLQPVISAPVPESSVKLEISGACSPVLYGTWRRRGKATGRRQRGSLAPPPPRQPSTGSKHWLWGLNGTCGLNGFLPSCVEPPLGPPHLNPRKLFSKGSGSVMLQEGGSSRSDVCSGVYSPPVGSWEPLRYQSAPAHSACKRPRVLNTPISRYGPPSDSTPCIRVNIQQGYRSRVLVYTDVRGPPKDRPAWNASSQDGSTTFGA